MQEITNIYILIKQRILSLDIGSEKQINFILNIAFEKYITIVTKCTLIGCMALFAAGDFTRNT
jgi:hypothetical protein